MTDEKIRTAAVNLLNKACGLNVEGGPTSVVQAVTERYRLGLDCLRFLHELNATEPDAEWPTLPLPSE